MAVTAREYETQDLRRLIPLNMLSGDRFDKLCAETAIEDAPRGSVLFSKGDTKNEFVYVLKGTVSLQADGMELETITGGTESSRFALAHQIPRKVSAVAKDRVRFIRVDASYVNQAGESSSRGKANYEVSEVQEDHDDDWVTTLLNSPIFQRLSPANLQQLLRNLEEIEVTKGQSIIRQDDPGDYYYVIKKGRCVLSRKPTKNSRDIKLAELKTCDTFGEDSLISDQPRNVSITMLTDGSLLRIDKANFLKLVKEPVISYVDYPKAQELVQSGAAWLDVRSVGEFELGHLPGAINIPFLGLRIELAQLDQARPYVLICENGKLSEAAAFLLIRNSFANAHVLRGGLAAVGGRRAGAVAPALVAEEPKRTVDLPPVSRPAASLPLPTTEPGSSAAAGVPEDLNLIEFAPLDSLALIDLVPAEESRPAAMETPQSDFRIADFSDQLIAAEAEIAALKLQLADQAEEVAALQRSLEQQLAALPVGDDARVESLESELQSALADKLDLEARLRSAQLAQPSSDQSSARIRELEAQVTELTSVVQEFLEQQASSGDEGESLHAELETVRAQANSDVMSLQTKLRAEEQEVARLRRELDGTYAQVLQLQTGIHVDGRRKSGWRNGVVSVAIGFALMMCGMLLALFLFKTTNLAQSLGAVSGNSESVLTAPVDAKPAGL
ncbi:MAG: cyclic nucleotide-binding domain-containing protein [Methylococcaceae bacterium]|nr:cyclic nucleotide-binding domain-containing protein [Methylococcaceae bacterium]